MQANRLGSRRQNDFDVGETTGYRLNFRPQGSPSKVGMVEKDPGLGCWILPFAWSLDFDYIYRMK